jgi:RNA polymerase sigma factor (sigma-70 family)
MRNQSEELSHFSFDGHIMEGMTSDDMELVRQYAANQSEAAFAALVARYLNLVYSVALRQGASPGLAEEAAQTVFLILARKAGSLGPKTILSGWLYRTACFVSAAALKRELRRHRREQEARIEMNTGPNEVDSPWERLAPLLDQAMMQLRDQDRNALVLRFFQNKSMREVGLALGVEERAAQKRVARSLEKLRGYFAVRGVASTTAILGEVICAHSVQVAPPALAKSITAAAVSMGAAGSGSTLTLLKGALKIMAWTKMKTAIVGGVAVILAVGAATTVIVKHSLDPDRVFVYKRDLSASETASYVERTGMSPSEAAKTFFDGLQRKDATAVRKFCPSGGYDAESLVEYYGGLTVLKLGKPFKGALKKDPGHREYHGVWVPFEIQLKDGKVHKWRVALGAGRFTNAASDHWYVDGGM